MRGSGHIKVVEERCGGILCDLHGGNGDWLYREMEIPIKYPRILPLLFESYPMKYSQRFEEVCNNCKL